LPARVGPVEAGHVPVHQNDVVRGHLAAAAAAGVVRVRVGFQFLDDHRAHTRTHPGAAGGHRGGGGAGDVPCEEGAGDHADGGDAVDSLVNVMAFAREQTRHHLHTPGTGEGGEGMRGRREPGRDDARTTRRSAT